MRLLLGLDVLDAYTGEIFLSCTFVEAVPPPWLVVPSLVRLVVPLLAMSLPLHSILCVHTGDLFPPCKFVEAVAPPWLLVTLLVPLLVPVHSLSPPLHSILRRTLLNFL